MWSDNDIDNAFQRLNPPEPEPTPFPLDAWLRLEDELDKAVIERAVRRRLWQFFAAEVAVVALVALGWLAWPTTLTPLAQTTKKPTDTTNTNGTAQRISAASTSHPTAIGAAARRHAAANSPAAAVAATPPAAPKTTNFPSAAASQPIATTTTAASEPTNAQATTGAAHLSLAAATKGKHPRHRADARLSLQPLTPQPNSHHDVARRHTTARQEQAAGNAASKTRQAAGYVSAAAHGAVEHPAAGTTGTIATPAEATTEAVVPAAASRSRHYRKGPSALLARPSDTRLTAALASATEALEPGTTADATAVSAATVASVASLVPLDASLLVPAAAGLPAPLATVAETPTNLPVAVRQPRFYVGLVAAPDVSTVRFASVEKPMPNVGVVLEYRITNRLRVNTGVLRSTKEYTARRDDYNWGAYSNQVYSHDFKDVDGTCTILDIPLNLRYDLIARPEYRVFGSAGVSSFFMQREHYYYDWTDTGGFHTWNGYAVNQNQHLFSVLNLSAGYERSLGRHLSVQAEPYLKVPLAGVGLGKVRLTSAGVFFGVKYGF